MTISQVEKRTPELLEQLYRVWERSVEATHGFLTPEDFRDIAREVPRALSVVEHLVAAYGRNGLPAGFLGAEGDRLEMLFLDPGYRGMGLGRQLAEYAIDRYGLRQVCVNEENPMAMGFYRHLGFQILYRTRTDEQCRPYPLLYMVLPVTGVRKKG